MNYLVDLTEDELKYICSVIPAQEAIGYFSKYPKEFAKIRPGFRAKSLTSDAVMRILFDYRKRDFIASFLTKHIDRWNKEINEEIEKDINSGFTQEEAYIDILSQSFFSGNIALYFKINGIKKGDDYLSVMSSAVSFQFENQKKAELEIESLQKTNSELLESNAELSRKLIDEEKRSEKYMSSEASLKKENEEKNKLIQLERENTEQIKKENSELKEKLNSTVEENLWKTEEMGQKIETLSSKVEELKKKTADNELVISDYSKKLASAEEESNAWKNQLRSREIQLFNYKAERATFITERESDREKIKSLKDALEAKNNKAITEESTGNTDHIIITENTSSRFSVEAEQVQPLRPEDMELFDETFVGNIESLGLDISDAGTTQFVSYLEKIVFSGKPIIMKRGPGINIANCLANTLYGVPISAMFSYKEGLGVSDIVEFLASTPDRVVCIDGFVGNCNELELIPALEQFNNKILFFTYMFERTLKYVPYEILSYCHYINVDVFGSILTVKNISEDPSEMIEKSYTEASDKAFDRRSRKILVEIANECGFSEDVANSIAEQIVDEESMIEMLLFTILPYTKKILGENPYCCSKRLQRYAGETGPCAQKEIIMRWFG